MTNEWLTVTTIYRKPMQAYEGIIYSYRDSKRIWKDSTNIFRPYKLDAYKDALKMKDDKYPAAKKDPDQEFNKQNSGKYYYNPYITESVPSNRLINVKKKYLS